MPSLPMLFPDHPGLSLVVTSLLVVLVMFGARSPMHTMIRGVARAITQGCKLTSEAIDGLRERVAERNREVLLSTGLRDTERQIEQEFRRISDAVDRDLGTYPALHRQLADQVARIDEDYRRATDAAPPVEAWSEALGAAVEMSTHGVGGATASRAVEALHAGMIEAHQEAMEEYRDSSRERHLLLSKMVPTWRSMDQTLARVERSVSGIFERSEHLDELMAGYREIAQRTDEAERSLANSALTQFAIATIVLVIALLGGFVNFQLIALPMSEMVGATSRLGSMQTSDIAALVIILIEITMGLFLMESLRITRLFPVIGRLDARTRRRMAWTAFGLLLVLASIEASLAYMRDLLAADRAALTQTLAGITAQRPEFLWIPSVGQMVMGFILPFALTFVAIPLESFIHAARIVGGQAVVSFLRLGSFSVRLLGFAADHVGKWLQNLYDVVIFLPLKVEEWIRESRNRAEGTESGLRVGKSAGAAVIALLLLSGCTPTPVGRGVFLLIDTSGTYAAELDRAQSVVNYLLGTLDPGDSFGVARIDGGSFSEKDIVVRVTFDERPSVSNDQKRHFLETVTDFTAASTTPAAHTDITGGVLQAVEWLNEVGSGTKTVLIFSDLEEDLPEGHIRDFPLELEGVRVIALNVTKLRADNLDPRTYLDRLDGWRLRVESGGGEWTVINDLERLDLALSL